MPRPSPSEFKNSAKNRRQLGKKHPSPRFNSVAVKDGRLRAAARPEGLTSSFERCKNAKSSHQLGAARAEKEGEGRKASCRLPFGRCSLPRSSCCCLGSADTIHILYIYIYYIYIYILSIYIFIYILSIYYIYIYKYIYIYIALCACAIYVYT